MSSNILEQRLEGKEPNTIWCYFDYQIEMSRLFSLFMIKIILFLYKYNHTKCRKHKTYDNIQLKKLSRLLERMMINRQSFQKSYSM